MSEQISIKQLNPISTRRKYLVAITPELAQKLLSIKFQKQRNIRPSVIQKYAYAMRTGAWHQGQADCVIYLNDKGNILYNGQHRLHAIIESKTTQKIWIEYDATEEDYKYMDSNVVRSAADQMNIPNAKDIAAISKMCIATTIGEQPLASSMDGWLEPQIVVPKDAITTYSINNQELLEKCRSYGNRMSRAWLHGRYRKILAYVAWFIITYLDGDYLEEFVNDFCADGKTTTNAIPMIRQYVVNKLIASDKKINNADIVAAFCCAYESYCNQDNKKRLLPSMVQKYRTTCEKLITSKRIKDNTIPTTPTNKPNQAQAKPVRLKKGDHVSHKTYGLGKVLSIDSKRDLASIKFVNDRDERTILLAYAVEKRILRVI